jgi:hypothetical protein
MASPLNRVASWLSKSLASTLGGAGVGGAVGAVTDTEDPLRGAEIGAVTGAVGGPTALAAERLFTRGALPAAKFLLSNSTAPSAIRRRALDELSDVANLDELSPADLRSRLDEYLGQPATLADVGGENMLARADAASKVPGSARNAAREALANRMDDQPARIMDLVRRHLTPSTDARLALRDLQEIKRREADQMYGGVYSAHPVVDDKDLYALMPRLESAGALGNAEQLGGITGVSLPKPTELELPDGTKKKVYQNLSAAQLDQVKRGLDDAIGAAKRAGEGEKMRALVMLKNEYLGQLDTLMPGYADARARFAGYSSSQQAVEEGRKFDTGQPEDTLAYFSSLDPGDQDFFRIGVGQRIKDLIASGAEGQDTVKRFFKKRGSREKLETIFPDPASYEAFRDGLERELDMARTAGKIQGGSPTQPRQLEERARLGADPLAYAALTPGGLGTRALNLALSLVGHDQDKINQLTAAEVTKLLLNPNVHLNRRALEDLAGRQRAERIKQIVSGGLQTAATAGGAGVTSAFTAQPRRSSDQEPAGMAEGGKVEGDKKRGSDLVVLDDAPWGTTRYGDPRSFRSTDTGITDFMIPFSDELDAWLGTTGEVGLPVDDPEYYDKFRHIYDDRLELERGAQERWAEKHPLASMAGSLASYAPLMFLAPEAAVARGASYLPRAASYVSEQLANALGRGSPGVLSKLAALSAAGTAPAAVVGFGEGEGGLGNRLESAGDEALSNAEFGPALALAGPLKRALPKIARGLSPRTADIYPHMSELE